MIKLSDRVKEISYTVGTGNLALEGAVVGFSSFGSNYNYNDYLFYAITDGTSYEVGSGQYILSGSTNTLRRFPLKSSNSNQLVNFPQGLKEVYVTYPATHSVYMGSGVSNYNTPVNSGVAFWATSNIVNYDSNFIWDSTNERLGIRKSNPQYAIDIGGSAQNSSIQSSGFYVGKSGVYFPPQNNEDVAYTGGRQLVHFDPNQLGDANINAIIELSGNIDNIFLLKRQNAGLVFAGPPSGCTPPCSPALPAFRPLILKDIEEMVTLSGSIVSQFNTVNSNLTIVSGIAQYGYDSSGVLRNAINSASGTLRNDLTVVSGIAQYGYNSSGVLRNDLITVSGIAQYGYDSSGVLRNGLNTLENKIYDTDIYSLGNISGVVNVDWAKTRTIQTASLSGLPTTFNKGTGWPTTSISRDVLLQLNVLINTDVTWNVVGSNWYKKPDYSVLNSGEHMVLLRAFGNTINGFYIGNKTSSVTPSPTTTTTTTPAPTTTTTTTAP
jgi:hypothetical protein